MICLKFNKDLLKFGLEVVACCRILYYQELILKLQILYMYIQVRMCEGVCNFYYYLSFSAAVTMSTKRQGIGYTLI